MGKGTMNCKDYKTKCGYYLDKDYDEKVGGEFYFLLLPLFKPISCETGCGRITLNSTVTRRLLL